MFKRNSVFKILTTRQLVLSGFFLLGTNMVQAQSFVPSVNLGGNPNPPQAYDQVNDDPNGNVGIGMFPNRPNPDEKLTVGGDISLWPDLTKPGFERKITAHDPNGLVGIYSKDFDQCQGAGIRLNGINSQDAGMLDLFSTGVSVIAGQKPAFLFTTYEPCNPFRRMVITRNGLAGIGSDIDGQMLNIDDRLTVDHTLALTDVNDLSELYIRGRSANHSMNLMVGAEPSDGAGIELFGRTAVSNNNTVGIPTASGITFSAYDFRPPNVQIGLAYKFMHRHYGTNSAFMSFSIDQLGNARFGPSIPASEKLTIDGDLYMAPANGSSFRNIVAHAGPGGLCLAAGSSQFDGSKIQLNGGTAGGSLIFYGIRTSATDRAFTFNAKTSSGGSLDVLGIDVAGNTHLSNDLDFNIAATTAHSIRGTHTALNLYSKTNATDGSAIEMSNSLQRFSVPTSVTGQTQIYKFDKSVGGTATNLMSIYNDGSVVVGNVVAPNIRGSYKLFVETGIMTERVNVAINGSGAWHDEVFASDYNLMPLTEVEQYTTNNKHLPDIPSAEEVVKTGVDVGAMESLLLKKIEELTLYAIQQQKTIEKQAAQLATIKSKLDELQSK